MANQKAKLEVEIKQMESVLHDSNTPANVKELLEPALANAKEMLANLEKQTVPTSAGEKKKAEKKAVKVVQSTKEVIKKAKEVVRKKPGTKAHSQSLQELVKQSKELVALYGNASEKSLQTDASRKAKAPGKRISSSGNPYREYRANRSDIGSKKPYLEEGGYIKNQYAGKNAKEVWDAWTIDQRKHFLNDHNNQLSKSQRFSNIDSIADKDYISLGVAPRSWLDQHIQVGQYAKGGNLDDHKDWRDEGVNDEELYNDEPDNEMDCFITDVARGGYDISGDGKFIGHYEDFDIALSELNKWKSKHKYYPNTWLVNDHGNMTLINDKGNEIKMNKGGHTSMLSATAYRISLGKYGVEVYENGSKYFGSIKFGQGKVNGKENVYVHDIEWDGDRPINAEEIETWVGNNADKIYKLDDSSESELKFEKGGQVSNQIRFYEYGTKNFTEEAKQAFTKAIYELDKEDKSSSFFDNASYSMRKLMEKVDELLSLQNTNGNESTKAHQLLQEVGIYNYKTGLLLDTGWLDKELSVRVLNKGGAISDNVQKLAREFSVQLHKDISEKQMKEVVRRNKTKEYIGACATHDFIDSNMTMFDAFTKVMGREYIFFDDDKPETEKQNERDTDLMNRAWSLAKENDFDPDKFAAGGRTARGYIRDRKFESQEPWEQAYDRKTKPKHPRYKKLAKGARTTRGHIRDRKFESQEPWEQAYDRKTKPKHPRYKKLAKGAKFDDKVKAIANSLEKKPVSKRFRGKYGSKYNRRTAIEAAKNIARSMAK